MSHEIHLHFPGRTDVYNKFPMEAILVSSLLSASTELFRTTWLPNFQNSRRKLFCQSDATHL